MVDEITVTGQLTLDGKIILEWMRGRSITKWCNATRTQLVIVGFEDGGRALSQGTQASSASKLEKARRRILP